MAGNMKEIGAFAITPHKVSVCILLQAFVAPTEGSVPYPFSSASEHNRFGLFLISLTKSCDNILEPKLDELMNYTREVTGILSDMISEQLTRGLSSMASPDDLFALFSSLRGTLGPPDMSAMVDNQILLDSYSHLGMYLRRCLLAFNLLKFEGVCHLLTNIGTYCKESFCPTDEFHEDGSSIDLDETFEFEDIDSLRLGENVNEINTSRTRSNKSSMFHIHAPSTLLGLLEDIQVSPGIKCNEDSGQGNEMVSFPNDASRANDHDGGMFLRTNWQVQGYLIEQADLIEKHASLFPMNDFESVLKQLQRLAPELHRVHYLRYLNNLYHEDYPFALENLYCYFDYSAGREGIDIAPSSSLTSFGRFGTALLCLGMMHCHFGHPKQALEVLSEAVQLSQQHDDDTCLSYTLTAICFLLSEIGISNATGIIGSAYSPMTSFGTSLSIQQQLLVLLTRSLKRAESLKLTRLVASNRLLMAEFNLKHVKRPLLSFGPKISTKLATSPANVLKELRVSSYLLSELGSDGASLTIDGAFSTTWLKSLGKPMSTSILLQENETANGWELFQFGTQPSSIPGSVLQLSGASYLLRATAWELYGSTPLARLNAVVHATCFPDASSSTDIELAYVKLIQHLAVFKGYKEAFAALKVAEEKFLSVAKSRIQLLKLQLLHDHALHRGHLKLAQRVCDEFGALASSVTGVDMELKAEACLCHTRTLLAANEFSQAAAVAHSVFCFCYKFNLQVENATSLLLLAEIHKKSGSTVLGLPYALASLSFCKFFNLDLLEASATLTLSELWLSLGSNHAKRALTLVHRALPLILGHGGLELRARAHIAVAKCYLSDQSFSVSEDYDLVMDPLRQASEDIQILEYHELAAEAFYLMAIVFNKLGQLEEREKAATSFKEHIIALENPRDEESLFSGM